MIICICICRVGVCSAAEFTASWVSLFADYVVLLNCLWITAARHKQQAGQQQQHAQQHLPQAEPVAFQGQWQQRQQQEQFSAQHLSLADQLQQQAGLGEQLQQQLVMASSTLQQRQPSARQWQQQQPQRHDVAGLHTQQNQKLQQQHTLCVSPVPTPSVTVSTVGPAIQQRRMCYSRGTGPSWCLSADG